jgi:hypothetical protein
MFSIGAVSRRASGLPVRSGDRRRVRRSWQRCAGLLYDPPWAGAVAGGGPELF